MAKKLKLIIKLFITSFLLYFVFLKVDINQVLSITKQSNYFYLFLAFLFFNFSKIVSAIRLNYYFKEIGVSLKFKDNLMLYYLGMFYNLFLPGGIGGDGYKAYLINKHFKVKLKDIITALFFDRLSGLIGLIFLGSLLFMFSSYNIYPFNILNILLFLLIIPFFYFLSRYLNKFLLFFKHTLFLGIVVQLFQLLSAYFILLSLHQNSYLIEFLVLFFISSILAVLPITIGGVGIREITFLYGLSFIGLNADKGVVFSLMFFVITLISSLIGVLFLNFEIKKED